MTDAKTEPLSEESERIQRINVENGFSIYAHTAEKLFATLDAARAELAGERKRRECAEEFVEVLDSMKDQWSEGHEGYKVARAAWLATINRF